MPESFAFRITGVEPRDAAWKAAGPELRREFWRAVVAIGLVVKDDELARGLDRHGRSMDAIAASTRANRRSAMGYADPNAPPLTPAYGLSRTRSLLRGRAGKDYAEFYWKFDAVDGVHWGRILGYHRKGKGRLPKRDVIGISPQSLTTIRHKAQIWWDYRKRGIVLEQAVRDFQLPATTPTMPARIPVVGRTDFANFTFGIGGDLSLAERATAAGTFTGFRQFHPPAPGAKVPMKPPAKPNTAAARAHQPHPFPPKPNTPRPERRVPVPVPTTPGPDPLAGVTFNPSRAAKAQRMATVMVDVGKLDAAFQRDKGFAIKAGGEGAIAGRIEGFQAFLAKARAEGIAIEQSQVVVKADGSVSFVDGRHRFSVMRDMGVKEVLISVPRGQADRARKFFGTTTPTNPAPKLQPAAKGPATPALPERAATVPPASPTAPILPGRPIAERIAAWDEGRKKIAALQSLGSDLAAARQAETAQKQRLEELAAAYKAAAKGAAKKSAKTTMDQATLDLANLTTATHRAEKQAREAAQTLLDAPRRLHLGLTDASHDRISEHQFDATREGMRWLQRCVSHPEGAPPLELDMHPIPENLSQRSSCEEDRINLAVSVSPGTVVHETGHHFDYHVPGFNAVAREFLAYRVGDEAAVQLRTVMSEKGKFHKDEYGKKDRFDEAFGESGYYAGKSYDDGMTEITSMGIEKMFKDPVGFATKDPEFATLVLGLMHGNLR